MRIFWEGKHENIYKTAQINVFRNFICLLYMLLTLFNELKLPEAKTLKKTLEFCLSSDSYIFRISVL